MSIEIKMVASLKHINVRKEGPDDDKVTAIDLKLNGYVTNDIIDKLLCPDDVLGFLPSQAFWDADGEPRFLSLDDIDVNREIRNMTVEVDGIELLLCKVSKFSFTAASEGQARLTLSVSSSDFPSRTIAILAEQLQESLRVHVWSPQADMFQQKTEEATA